MRLGRTSGYEVRLHIHLPLLALVVLLASVMTDRFSPAQAVVAMGVLTASVAVHEVLRAIAASRVGGHANLIVLTPLGGATRPILPADPPAHLVTALVGPAAYLGNAVAGACVLAATGRVDVLGLLSLFAPAIDVSEPLPVFALQAAVWINAWLLMINLVPAPPLDGAELVHAMLWPIVGRASASAALSHFALGAAGATALLGIVLQHRDVGNGVPAWFPLSVLSVVLLYGGNRLHRQRRYDFGLDIEQLAPLEPLTPPTDSPEDREAVLVEHLQQQKQETIDRKRREREVQEDARVDDILSRLSATSFEELSEEEQAILKRASRRYRRRRDYRRER